MVLSTDQSNEIKEILGNSLTSLYANDITLIERRGLERSIGFRIGLYLSEGISDFEWMNHLIVDLEYTKNVNDQKRLRRRPRGVQPDIIIHHRGNNESNALVIEVKCWWHPRAARHADIIKLEDFTNQDEAYKYGLGALVEIGRERFEIQYYVNGAAYEEGD